ncbi:MAG: hypothetical protein VW516_08130, partial [Rhodospirillaceae bacterium]
VRTDPLPAETPADPITLATSPAGGGAEPNLHGLPTYAGFPDIGITGHRPFGPVIAVDITVRR